MAFGVLLLLPRAAPALAAPHAPMPAQAAVL
jgi:hypothetical protein